MERPQRHRRNVNHYTDDNPSTFTIKRKRGESPPSPPSTSDSAAQRRAARAEGRRQRELQQLPQMPHISHQAPPQHAQSTSSVSSFGSSVSSKRTRPPSSHSHKQTQLTTPTAQVTSRKRTRPKQNAFKPQQQVIVPKDVIHSHTVSVQPVLPLNVPERCTLEQRWPQLYLEDYVGSFAAPTAAVNSNNNNNTTNNLQDSSWTRIAEAYKERWVPLMQSSSSHDAQNAEEEETSLIAFPAAPWTCFAVRQDDPLYFCVGDAAGNLLLYSSQPKAVCIQSILTCAAKREAERPILWSPSKSTVLSHNSPNSIGACAWHVNVAVVWTKQEVEIFDVVQHSTLMTLSLDHASLSIPPTLNGAPPLAAATDANNNNNNNQTKRRQPQSFSYQSLDLHPTQPLLLWRPLGCRAVDAAEASTVVSLYCVDFSDPVAGAERRVLVPSQGNNSGSIQRNRNNNDHKSNGKESKTKDARHDILGFQDAFCHAAVWDIHSSQNEILMVQSQPRQKNQENGNSSNGSGNNNNNTMTASLCRVQVDTGEIAQRTQLPESGSVSGRLSTIYTDCVMEQYEDYLFLCTGRGIRCYERNRLTFLTVYGETVALHGTTVGWQGCFWIPEPSFDPAEVAVSYGGSNSFKSKQSCWIQRKDELCRRDQVEQQEEHERPQQQSLLRHESSSSNLSVGHGAVHRTGGNALSGSMSSIGSNGSCPTTKTKANKLFSNMLLVGIPHPSRGPAELQSTLYVWKPGQVLPLTTLQAPAGGLLGLHIHATATTGWRLTCATAKHGQGWQLSATLKSDFSGTMYPVGYQVLTENVEYLEDEGELDQVLVYPQQQQQRRSQDSPVMEETDLQKALKRSLETASEDKISVLLEAAEMELDRVMVPSVPDPSLCEAFKEGELPLSGVRSPGRRVRSAPQTLALFPQFKMAKESAKDQQDEHSKRQMQPPSFSTHAIADSVLAAGAATQQAIAAMKAKGKRSRTTNVEAMLQTSVDPNLKQKMDLLNKEWRFGGSRLPHFAKNSSSTRQQHPEVVPFLHSATNPLSAPPKLVPVSIPNDLTTTTTPVTPSEPSPATTVDGNEQHANSEGRKVGFCAACHDRMVIHTCGRRELPVDTEALERAEKARKEAEEAEAKRVRAEKRRLAEAKRREARRKKKEEEDRRRYMEKIDEERRLREEEERKVQFTMLHPEKQRVTMDLVDYGDHSATSRPSIPKFSELQTNGGYNVSSGSSMTHGFFSSTSSNSVAAAAQNAYAPTAAGAAASAYPPKTESTGNDWSSAANCNSYYNISERTEHQDTPPISTTLTGADGDALAALVGLADSLAPKSNTPPPAGQEVQHYDYSGSSDRRTAILAQLSQFKQLRGDSSEAATSAPGEQTPYYSSHSNTTNYPMPNGGASAAYNGETGAAPAWAANPSYAHSTHSSSDGGDDTNRLSTGRPPSG